MSAQGYQNSPDVQAYLNLTNTIEYGEGNSGGLPPSSLYFASANYAFTTLLASKVLPSSLRLSTINSFAAYYAIGFFGEVVSEMLTRNGNAQTAAYFGNDPANFNADFGDKWYHDLGESLVDATVDTFMGLANTIDAVFSLIQNPGQIVTGLSTMLENALGGKPGLSYDSLERNGLGFTFTYRGGGGNDYFDLADRPLSHPTLEGYDQLIVYGGGGRDLIANVNQGYGESGDDQIQYVDTAWGGSGNDYILHVDTAYGEAGADYIVHVDRNAHGGDGNDFIEKTHQVAYGDSGNDILVNNNVSRGGDGNDYIVGSSTNYIAVISGLLDTNILDGGNGDDYLEGRGQDDDLIGGAGNDILIGGGGKNILDGGSGDDIAVMRGNTDFKVYHLDTSLEQFWYGDYDYRITGRGTDRIRNIETVLIQGGQGNNTLDATQLGLSSTLDGLGGNDTLKGGSNHDFLFGGSGQDNLQGNAGDDVLMGGEGLDTLRGGAGADVFFLQELDTLDAIIKDFNRNEDAIKATNLSSLTAQTTTYDGKSGVGVMNGSTMVAFLEGATAADVTTLNNSFQSLENTRYNIDNASTALLSPWHLLGSGDFDGDGDDDMLWQHQGNGQVHQWEMENGQRIASHNIFMANPVYLAYMELIGTGDFDGDGHDDILWQSRLNGQVHQWKMYDGQLAGASNIFVPNPALRTHFELIGAGDFNGNGNDDLLWQDRFTGAVVQWHMQNGQPINVSTIAASSNRNAWQLVGAIDFDGDNDDDLLWRETATGQVYGWEMENGQRQNVVSEEILVGEQASEFIQDSWNLIGAGDFQANDADAIEDLLFQDSSSGQVFAVDVSAI
ncbi:MAG: calcium-binding protein [Cyanobacteria bacterium P01_F01_bin.56]